MDAAWFFWTTFYGSASLCVFTAAVVVTVTALRHLHRPP